MIIVEGPDGAGKTRLVTRIEGMLNITREPRAVSKEAKSLRPLDDYIEEELEKGFGLRLYDRFALISTPNYIPLPNRTLKGRMLDPQWLRTQYRKFSSINPAIIYCLPPIHMVVENVHTGDDNLVVQSHIEEIYYLYHCFAARGVDNGATMIWDYTRPAEYQLTSLLKWARARAERGL